MQWPIQYIARGGGVYSLSGNVGALSSSVMPCLKLSCREQYAGIDSISNERLLFRKISIFQQNTENNHPSGGDSSSSSDSVPDTLPTKYSVSPHHHPPTRFSRKNKMHTCVVCQKQFPRPSGLSTHMKTHTGDRRT